MSGRSGFERHLEILHTVAETVGRSLDVEEVLRTALDALTHVTGHEISSLHLLSEDGRTLHLRGDRGLSPELREINLALSVGHGLIGGVAATGKTLNVRNAAQSPDLLPAAKRAVQKDRQRGFLCVPIHCRGRILGTLSLGRQTSQTFGEREVALVEATADQIGIALDNARLYSESLRQLDELKRAQAQLVHAEKLSAVGELASGVAHEINNPLTTILGQAQLLLERADVTPHVRDRLTIVSDEAARAARIVQNLLLFSRHYAPERRPCSLADQVRRVLELKAYQLASDTIEVETEFEDCPPVWADENQVQQVILNLVQNAHQAMAQEDERVLTVRVRPIGGAVALEVLDTGGGITAEALPRLFDPFFTTKPNGTGLGLPITRRIVQEHRGVITVSSEPHQGTTFTILLPSVVLGTGVAGVIMRHTRSAMLQTLGADYVRTARAKSVPERLVVLKHALRNALIPIITLGAIEFGRLLSGAVLTEQVFAIPGFGKLLVDGVFNRDYAVVQAVVLVSASLYVLLNLGADVLYFLANPRLRGTP